MASSTCGDFTSTAGKMEYTDTSHSWDLLHVELMFSKLYLLYVSHGLGIITKTNLPHQWTPTKVREFVEVFSGHGEVSRGLRDVTWQKATYPTRKCAWLEHAPYVISFKDLILDTKICFMGFPNLGTSSPYSGCLQGWATRDLSGSLSGPAGLWSHMSFGIWVPWSQPTL